MKVTIIFHLAAFYLYVVTDKKAAKLQIIVTFMFSWFFLKYEICNRIWN